MQNKRSSSGSYCAKVQSETTISGPGDNMTNADGFNYTSSDVDIEKYVQVGKQTVREDQVDDAFGGTWTSGPTVRSGLKLGNSAPIGLSGFGISAFVTGLCNCAPEVIGESPAIAIGVAMFYGGILQVLCAVFELLNNNTFGAFAAGSYGAYWLSWSMTYLPALGIQASYTEQQFAYAWGFYMIGWTIVTAIIFVCTFKSTIALCALYLFLLTTYILLVAKQFTGSQNVQIASGVVSVLTALIAWYNAYAGLATRQNSYITVHPITLPGGRVSALAHKHE